MPQATTPTPLWHSREQWMWLFPELHSWGTSPSKLEAQLIYTSIRIRLTATVTLHSGPPMHGLIHNFGGPSWGFRQETTQTKVTSSKQERAHALCGFPNPLKCFRPTFLSTALHSALKIQASPVRPHPCEVNWIPGVISCQDCLQFHSFLPEAPEPSSPAPLAATLQLQLQLSLGFSFCDAIAKFFAHLSLRGSRNRTWQQSVIY